MLTAPCTVTEPANPQYEGKCPVCLFAVRLAFNSRGDLRGSACEHYRETHAYLSVPPFMVFQVAFPIDSVQF